MGTGGGRCGQPRSAQAFTDSSFLPRCLSSIVTSICCCFSEQCIYQSRLGTQYSAGCGMNRARVCARAGLGFGSHASTSKDIITGNSDISNAHSLTA
eukprot:6548494-Prymnesium_polylepis.2